MRRLVCVLAALLASTGLAGCSGADANRARALLDQAQQAQRSVRSEGFVVHVTVEAEGKSGGVTLQGGAYVKGPRAGDFFVTGTPTGDLGSAAGTAMRTFTVVRRGAEVRMDVDGRRTTLPAAAARSRLGTGADPAKLLDLARYVKSVSVEETDLNGRPADRIVGTLDTTSLLAGLGGVDTTKALGAFGVHVGDIQAALVVPRDTHLVEVMLADLSMSFGGHRADMHLSVAVNGVNRPLSFPSL